MTPSDAIALAFAKNRPSFVRSDTDSTLRRSKQIKNLKIECQMFKEPEMNNGIATRREVLKAVPMVAAGVIAAPLMTNEASKRDFPRGFMWGPPRRPGTR